MKDSDKVRENRLRRKAERQGLMLRKSRRRDVDALDYGMYMLVDAEGNHDATGHGLSLSLEDVEDWLTSDNK